MSRRKQLNPKPLITTNSDIAQTKVTIGLSYNTITTTTNKNDLDSNYKDLKINIKRLESDNQVKESLAEKIDHMATSEFKEQNQQLLKLINHPENDTNSQILSSPSRTLNDAVKKTTKDSDNSLFKLKKRQKTEHSIDDLNNNVTNCNEINTIEKSKDLNTSPRNSDRIGSLTKIGPETIESSNDIDTSSKLNTVTNSILVNGKRYYPLIFSCDNCGLRYSDQSTMLIHKQNYCSKRLDLSLTRSASNSPSPSSASSSRSSSRSPNRASSDGTGQENGITRNREKNQSHMPIINQNIFFRKTHSSKSTEDYEKLTIDSDQKKGTDRNDIQLVKSTIFQCNSCLFQTDKKPMMNRHSRVHLSQKRKSMEDCENFNTSNAKNFIRSYKSPEKEIRPVQPAKSPDVVDKNDVNIQHTKDRNQSYCFDCDIQFSSISTYQHHRSNYCQKYKTIEAIVPLELASSKKNGNSQEPINHQPKNNGYKSQKNRTVSENTILPKSSENYKLLKTIASKSDDHVQSNTKQTTNSLGAVRMGDMVYLPVYKVTSKEHNRPEKQESPILLENTKKSENDSMVKQFLQNNTELIQQINLIQTLQKKSFANDEEILKMKQIQEIIEMRVKLSASGSNDPLDLSTKAKSNSSLKYEDLLRQQLQKYNFKSTNGHNNKSTSSSDFSPEALHLQSLHQQLVNQQNQLQLSAININSPHGQINNPLAMNPVVQKYSLYDQLSPLQSNQQESPPVQNKIYHCRNCQQLFFKLSLFETHVCNTKVENKLNTNSWINAPKPYPVENHFQVSVPKTISVQTNNLALREAPHIDETLLRHPLVMKTISENYSHLNKVNKSGSASELSAASIGTGSEQGFVQSKNFFMCTNCGYRGNTARGVKQHGKLHLSQGEQFAVINITNRSNEPILIYNSKADFETQTQLLNKVFSGEVSPEQSDVIEVEDTTKEKEVLKNEVIKSEEKESKNLPNPMPFSKKARILDLHYNQQKSMNAGSILTGMPLISPSKNSAQIEKSQTYCFKCNIQFQHITNYLAHKKLYCK